MKQKTAMQELRLRLIDRSEQFRRADMLGPFTTLTLVLTEIELELLEKEKEQIENAYTEGYLDDGNTDFNPIEYYNKTYKQD